MNSIKTVSFGNFLVSFRDDAFLNATAIAKQYGKRVGDYLRNDRTQEYIEALAENLSRTRKITLNKKQLVAVKNGGTNNGTWLHPKLAIDFARWLDPKFAVWCDEQIEQLLSGSLQPKPTKALPNGLTAEQIETVKKLHNALVKSAPKEQQAKIAITLWSAVKSKFGVSYKEVPAEQFTEVLSVMSRVAVEKGVLYGEVLDRLPETGAYVALSEREFSNFATAAYYLDWATRQLYDLSEPLKRLGARDKGTAAYTLRMESHGWLKHCRETLQRVQPEMRDAYFREHVAGSLRRMDALMRG